MCYFAFIRIFFESALQIILYVEFEVLSVLFEVVFVAYLVAALAVFVKKGSSSDSLDIGFEVLFAVFDQGLDCALVIDSRSAQNYLQLTFETLKMNQSKIRFFDKNLTIIKVE